jgi:hypothetical protein
MVNNHNTSTISLPFEFLISVYFHDETGGRAARRVLQFPPLAGNFSDTVVLREC